MLFKDVTGQDKIKKKLIRFVTEQRISHALMFTGPEGSGKLALALAYAQFVSCLDRKKSDSCGVCSSCRKYQKLVHPDLHFVFPVFKLKDIKNPVSDDFLPLWREMVLKTPYFTFSQWLSFIKSENAQGMIYEAESESIIKKLSLKSFESEYKIMIIWMPEKMHNSCSNKLLKLIEEPPVKTLFLLITGDEESVITTIRSRAQLIQVPPVDNEAMHRALISEYNYPEEEAADAVRLANGNIITALEYLEPGEESFRPFNSFQELMRFAYSNNIPELLKWTDKMSSLGRDRQKAFFNASLRFVREYFIMNLKNFDLNYLSREEKEWGERFAPYINERNVIPLSKEFEKGVFDITKNGNARIVFFDTAIKVARLIKA